MSSERNDGGPAHPVLELDQRSGNVFAQHMGMTLRDWFAGQAMSAIIIGNGAAGVSLTIGAAKDAYAVADAMLAMRSKP